MRQLSKVSIIFTAINSTLSITILVYDYTNPRLVFLFTLHIQLNNKTAPIEYQTQTNNEKNNAYNICSCIYQLSESTGHGFFSFHLQSSGTFCKRCKSKLLPLASL